MKFYYFGNKLIQAMSVETKPSHKGRLTMASSLRFVGGDVILRIAHQCRWVSDPGMELQTGVQGVELECPPQKHIVTQLWYLANGRDSMRVTIEGTHELIEQVSPGDYLKPVLP